MKSKAKENNNSNKSSKKDEMMILLEDISGQVKAVAEGHSILERKMDKMDLRLDGIDSRLDGIDSRLDGTDSRLDRMESKMDTGFKLILEHLDGLDREFMKLKEELENNYEKKGHDAEWRKMIEGRVEKLEKLLVSRKTVST